MSFIGGGYETIPFWALALAISLWVTPVGAQTSNCMPLKMIQKRLLDRFQERQFAIAHGTEGKLIYLFFKSPGGGSWSVVFVDAANRDVGCIIAGGKNWQSLTGHADDRPT